MIKRILLNLLSNALKFSTEGHVRVAAQLGADKRIELCVEDTGIGIPAEALPTLMQPFVQIDGSLARKYEGTGLGLSLVKSMVELHGGSVAMASEVGVGTTVTMHFPADRTLAAGQTTPIARLSGGAPGDRAPAFSAELQLATAQ
jgi:signal transduction histidine kinase